MSKLEDFTRTAGMNGGAAVYAKMLRTADIETDPALSSLFPIAEETLNAVIASMRGRGYDKAEPLVVWKGRNIVVDGHTRLKAAGETGITELPVEEKEFESIEEAALYAYGRQANRRNLTQAEIYKAAVGLKDKAERDGNGRAAEKLAKLLDISESTIYRARAIDEKAGPEVIEAVKKGGMSINKAYQRVKKQKTPVAQPDTEYAPPGMESEASEGTAPFGFELPEPLDIILPENNDAFWEMQTSVQPEEETGLTEGSASEDLAMPEPLDRALPENNEAFSEPVNGPEEAGILSMLEQAIEIVERFLASREGEETGEPREALALLQKIRNQYITGGEPS